MADFGQKRQAAIKYQQQRLFGPTWLPSCCNRNEKTAPKQALVFHHNNACPHVECRVVESIANKGWELLPHTPYSSTEAPIDHHVNRMLNYWNGNGLLEKLEVLVIALNGWIAS